MSGYGPQWRALQVANPNVGGLMSTVQSGINNAGDAGQEILSAYDAGQKLKNDAAVAQELAGIDTPEQMDAWLKQGGLNGRNVSASSLEAMMGHRQDVLARARQLEQDALRAAGSSPSGAGPSRSSTGRSRSRTGSSSSDTGTEADAATTNALIAMTLGGTPAPAATPVAGPADTGVVRPQARPTETPPPVTGPAPFVPGATSTAVDVPDLTSLSDDDLAAEIAALGG